MILAFDTSGLQCTAALFQRDGSLSDRCDETIGRGHAERLVPMLAEIVGDRPPSRIAVGIGPGSFTGIRVAVAAAHGLAIGWNAEIVGFSSMALVAASAPISDKAIGVALLGGHGQLFVQQFDGRSLEPLDEVQSLAPADAASAISSECIIGSGAASLIEARGFGTILEGTPSAANLFRLPASLRHLDAKPVYVRAPDAKAKAFA